MNYQQFVDTIKSSIPVGVMLANPGGGTSKIISYSDENIVYQRGNSKISVSFDELYKAYIKFKGQKVYTTDLRDYAPKTFDSSRGGHSCNSTFLFSILNLIDIIKEIKGEGKPHHPFYASIIGD
ncbi:MAG: hypothetical protein Q7S46_00790 [Gallionella sp.]|nr:hypothetical protein [Gallionella sp.]